MVRLPSASSLKRVLACPGSAVLPQVGSITEASEKGTQLHEYLALRLIGRGEEVALVAVKPEYWEEAKAIDLSEMPTFEWVRTEVAFAYDPSTRVGRILGDNINRQYEKFGVVADEEYACTIDWCGKTADGRLVLGDWKTGNAYTVEAAKDNSQLLLGALCVRSCFGNQADLEPVHAAIVRTKETTRFDWASYDPFDLELFSDQLDILKTQLREMAPEKPRLVEGAHCQYCPAFNYCPAKTALMRALSVTPGLLADDVQGMLTEGNAATAYMRYRAIKAALRKLDTAFQEYAARTPISLPDGKVYGRKTSETPELDPLKVRDVMLEMGYHGKVLDAALALDTSKAAIDRAMGMVAERGQKASLVRNVLAAVEARGGIVLKRSERIVEHDPKKGDE